MLKRSILVLAMTLPLAALAANPPAPAPATEATPSTATAPATAPADVPKKEAPKPRKPHSKLRAIQKDCNNMADQKKLSGEERKKYLAECMRTH